ncbi:MAG TPA: MarR family transcriptional regulator [Hyphomicrobiaceae bacterium]|nr:MarR family transcriptional regulator [Hyphomicrobiaceae bacterium]
MTAQPQRRPNLKLGAKTEPASKQRLRLWLRLLRTSRAIEAELRERLRVAFDMTLPKFDVMAALQRRPAGMTMTELSRFLMVSNGNVTGIIDRLAAEGMVARRPHEEDRRATFVHLTPKGARQFATMAKAHEAWVNEILGNFGDQEIRTMIALLNTPGFKSNRSSATTHQEARDVR